MSERIYKKKIKVLRVGRKWIEAEIEGVYGAPKVLINEFSGDFKKDKTYEMYATCEEKKNRYGTVKTYYPVSKESYDEQQSFLDIEDTKEKLLYKIGKYTRYNSTAHYKLEYIYEKSLEFKEEIDKISKYPEMYDSLKNIVVTAFNDLILDVEGCIRMFNIYEKLTSIYGKDICTEDMFNRMKKKFEDYYLNELNEIEVFYDKGYPVFKEIYDKESYAKLDKKGYISDVIKEKIEKLKSKKESINTERIDSVMKNIFSIRDKNAFNMSLSSLKFKDSEIDRIFKRAKYRGDEKVYILSYRLEKEFFKKALNKYGLIEISEMNERGYRFREYICRNPYLFLYKLVEGGYIDLDSIENNDSPENEVKKIMLWSDNLTEPFSFRKEHFDSQDYYFITKKMYNSYNDFNYNAYYIVGFDKDTGRGFSHRLPWFEDKYEKMSIEEIVRDTFKLDKGYKRIQGDVIVKEFDAPKKIDVTRYIDRIVNIDGSEKTYYFKIKGDNSMQDEINKLRESEFKYTDYEFRKNLHVEGDYFIGNNVFSPIVIFKECKVYCNNKEVAKFDKPVKFNTYGEGTKIKYNLYYEDVELNVAYNYREEVDEYYLLKLDDEEERVRDIKKMNVYLGEHLVQGNVIRTLYRPVFGRTLNQVYCFGEFSIKHSEHTYIKYGSPGKVYSIELAKRHKSKMLRVVD